MNFNTQEFQNLGWAVAMITLISVAGVLCYLVIRRGLQSLLTREHISRPFYVLVKGLSKWLLIIVTISLVLHQMGIKMSHILAAILTLAGMVAIGFIAVWSIMSNILCSLFMITFGTFNIGDEIEILDPGSGQGLKGRVVSFNVMFTSISETLVEEGDGVFTQIPNNIFFQKAFRRRAGRETETLGIHLMNKPLTNRSWRTATGGTGSPAQPGE